MKRPLDASLAKSFAWLIRKDVRGKHRSFDVYSDSFERWWRVSARIEYGKWSEVSESQRNDFFQLDTSINIAGCSLGIPKLLQSILDCRPDVLKSFAKTKKANPEMLAAWFWVLGISEHQFSSSVPIDYIRNLDQMVHLNINDDNKDALILPNPSLLMYLTWTLLGPEMQKRMDLRKAQTLNYFIAWFFCAGIALFKFDALIANRWRAWLQQKIPFRENDGLHGLFPRFALLEYGLMESKNKPDLVSKEGVEYFKNWADSQIIPGQKWAWLNEVRRYDEQGFPLQSLVLSQAVDESHRTELTADKKPFGVNLYGFALGELGLGEDLRMAVECCKAAGIPYYIVNISLGKDIRQNDLFLEKELSQTEKPPYPINIFCMPGFDVVARIFLPLGSSCFDNYYNIGWWPWELSVWPKAWDRAFDLVDEVWGCSPFSFEMYQKSTSKPCMLMPLSASVDRVGNYSRAHFGLPPKKKLFLYVYDFSSHLERKNPMALIAAFEQEFARDLQVGLVLKIMNSNPDDHDWFSFKQRIQSNKQVFLIEKTLDRAEILSLVKLCDVYVSPHRAEGFGRTLAEAMLFGKPVVATNYSGNQFFMDPQISFPVDYKLINAKEGDYHFIENEDEAVWAEISIKHLAKQMRAALAISDQVGFHKKVQSYAKDVFSPARIGMLIKEQLIKTKMT